MVIATASTLNILESLRYLSLCCNKWHLCHLPDQVSHLGPLLATAGCLRYCQIQITYANWGWS